MEIAVSMAEEAGYRNLKAVMAAGESLKTGDKVYAVCMNKMIALFRIGEEPVSSGMNILGAHIDSPRIDVKQNPLYENEGWHIWIRTITVESKNISGWLSRFPCTELSQRRTERL